MKQKHAFSGYTLIEIIVVISILGVIALTMGQFNFARLTQKQAVSIEIVKVRSILEEVRNNFLFGKAVGSGALIPSEWRIQISTAGSGRLVSEYLSGSTWVDFRRSWNVPTPLFLSPIVCKNFSETITGSLSGTGTISFKNGSTSFTGTNCTNQNMKILELEMQNRGSLEKLRYNAVTGVIESL